jgi:CO dehydrogenase maturation factor
MKVAFVGKGGSGKSTITALFASLLILEKHKTLIIDADINIHIPQLLGISIDSSKALSLTENTQAIKRYLMGTNPRIESPRHFYKTTPPGSGSNFVMLQDQNVVIANYAQKFAHNAYCMFVGTYTKDGIGTSCYHNNLSILENILSHTKLEQDEWLITDMVAGVDAFSNTLHAQFDALFLVTEPSRESADVYAHYKELAEHAGVYDRLFVIGNKIETQRDVDFLSREIGQEKLIACMPKITEVKYKRQDGEAIDSGMLTDENRSVLKAVEACAREQHINPAARQALLYKLHAKYAAQEYVKRAVGDISGQIDPTFTW